MRHFKSYITLMLLTAISLLSSCSDDFDTPPMMVPTANRVANITIADLKAKYWQDEPNYIATVEDDLVIAGRVISSDETGNIYQRQQSLQHLSRGSRGGNQPQGLLGGQV